MVFTMPAPFMVDSAAEPATSTAVDYALIQYGDRWMLTVTPDAGWLANSARVYPVRIDPTITAKPAKVDCWISSDDPATSHCGPGWDYLRVGSANSGDKRRALLRFDPSSSARNQRGGGAQGRLDEPGQSRGRYGCARSASPFLKEDAGSCRWLVHRPAPCSVPERQRHNYNRRSCRSRSGTPARSTAALGNGPR